MFKPVSSSSAGNCYLMPGLIIEAGISIAAIRKASGFSLSGRECLVSHEHGDHSKAVKDLIKAGVNCWMSAGTAEALGVAGHRVKIMEAGKQYQVGGWQVVPFDVVHDAAEPFGFLLAKGDEKWAFITDTAYVSVKMGKGLTGIAIEANYCPEILADNVAAGRIGTAQKNRLLFSHFSIDNVLEFLKANDLSRVREIHLLHLSNGNSNAEEFKAKVQAAAGKPVMVAAA